MFMLLNYQCGHISEDDGGYDVVENPSQSRQRSLERGFDKFRSRAKNILSAVPDKVRLDCSPVSMFVSTGNKISKPVSQAVCLAGHTSCKHGGLYE